MDQMETEVPVILAPPDVPVSGGTGARVNLFLYRVTEDAQLKNQEILGAGNPADYGQPPLSLDLHYLITAYGSTDEDDVDAQRILGDAMRVLHDHGMITEKLLRKKGDKADQPVLDPSLRDQFEKIKVYLDPISLEDLTKIWTALTKPYRLSAAYSVGLVQIRGKSLSAIPKLVGELPSRGPKVHVLSFHMPQIAELRLHRLEDLEDVERRVPYGRIGDTLIILGQNLGENDTRIVLGGVDATAGVVKRLHDRIEVVIPQDDLLQPGPQTAMVTLDMMMGDPPEKHMGFPSNQAVFMLVPKIEVLTCDLDASPKTLEITGSRLFSPNMECMTIIGSRVIISKRYNIHKESGRIAFDLPEELGAGEHPVRVRVNGAENIEDKILVIPA
jgi:hypothetical protein